MTPINFRVVGTSFFALFIDSSETDDLPLALVRLLEGFTVGTGYVAKYPIWPTEYKKLWKDSIWGSQILSCS